MTDYCDNPVNMYSDFATSSSRLNAGLNPVCSATEFQ